MARIGPDKHPHQVEGIHLALASARQVDAMQRHLEGKSSTALIKGGSPLAALIEELPAGPVTLEETVWEGLWTAYTSLKPVINSVEQNRAGDPAAVLIILVRSALLASARVAYAIAPGEDRFDRARHVMHQEASSLKRWYSDKASHAFQEWMPEDRDYRQEMASTHGPGRPLSETAMLRQLARTSAGFPPPTPSEQAGLEQELMWTFNVASGVAHGFAWPWQLPRVGDFPGDFVRMLALTSMLVDGAHQLAFQEGGTDPRSIIEASSASRWLPRRPRA